MHSVYYMKDFYSNHKDDNKQSRLIPTVLSHTS